MEDLNDPLTDDWTEEKCIQLIYEFRDHPILWDKSHKEFYITKRKTPVWEDIANVMNSTPDIVKHKMGILMTSFRRERSRTAKSLKSENPAHVYHSLWWGWEHMTFLLNKEDKKKMCQTNIENNITQDDILNVIEDQGEKSVDSNDIQLESYKRKAEDSQQNMTNNRAPMITISSTSEEGAWAPSFIISCEPSTTEDEINTFSTFLTSKLRKYNDVTKTAVQQEICDILFNADKTMHEVKSDPLSDLFENEVDDSMDGLLDPGEIKVYYSDSD